jgi:acyl carrier protein
LADARSRLTHCFSVVFPDLTESEIPRSSVASVAAWDSLASINLYSLLEEEFSIEVSMDDLDRLLSFELILEYLEEETGVS